MKYKFTILALSILVLCVSVRAQETPQTIRDKFTRETTHTSSQPVRQPQGFFKPFGAGFALSTAVCVAGAAADIGSSIGKQELNPILRNQQGGLNVGRAILLKLPACFLPVLFERKHPKLAAGIRFAAGGAWSLVAIRN